LTENQLKEADENLKRYLEHALLMYKRIKSDPEGYAQFKAALTEFGEGLTMETDKGRNSLKSFGRKP
jgi:hypothetical protein